MALGVAFAAKLVLARKMPPQAMGIVVTAQSFVALTLAAAELGIPDAVVRFVGREAEPGAAPKRTVSLGLHIVVPAALLTAAVVLAVVLGWSGAAMTNDARWTTVILTGALPLLAVGDVLGAAYRGVNRLATKLFAIDVARPGVVVLALLISPVALTQYASYVAALYAAGALLTAAALWLLFVRDARWHDRGTGSARDLLRFGVPIAGAGIIAGPLVNSALPLMLASWPGPTAVALFTVALSLQAVVYVPMGVLEQAVIPTWTRMIVHDTRAELAASYTQFTNLGFSAAASLGILLVANDRAILDFLFGPTYEAASWALRCAIAAALFAAATGPNEAMLRALGLTTSIFHARIAAALGGLVAGTILIPVYELRGGVVAFVLASVAVNGLYGVILYRAGDILPFSRSHTLTVFLAIGGLLSAFMVSGPFSTSAWIAAHICALTVLAVNADLRSNLRKLLIP